MAIAIDSIQILQEYLQGVLKRSDHHAPNVDGVALTLIGAIVWKADGEIKVRERDGETANILWFNIGNAKYAMTYNHGTQSIDMRERTLNGNVLFNFNNSSSYQYIIDAFRSL